MLRLLDQIWGRLSRPVVEGIKDQIYRLIITVAVIALGIACLIICLSYLGTALRQSLVPSMGLVGADVLLGGLFGLVAAVLLFLGLRGAR
jgi:uncharacterized membrane protein required for colicin V production